MFTATCSRHVRNRGRDRTLPCPELDGRLPIHSTPSLTPEFRRADRCEEEDAARRCGRRVVDEWPRCVTRCGAPCGHVQDCFGGNSVLHHRLPCCACNVAPERSPGVLCVAPSLGGGAARPCEPPEECVMSSSAHQDVPPLLFVAAPRALSPSSPVRGPPCGLSLGHRARRPPDCATSPPLAADACHAPAPASRRPPCLLAQRRTCPRGCSTRALAAVVASARGSCSPTARRRLRCAAPSFRPGRLLDRWPHSALGL